MQGHELSRETHNHLKERCATENGRHNVGHLLVCADGEVAYAKKSVFTSWSSQVNSGVACALYHRFRSGQFVKRREHKHFIESVARALASVAGTPVAGQG